MHILFSAADQHIFATISLFCYFRESVRIFLWSKYTHTHACIAFQTDQNECMREWWDQRAAGRDRQSRKNRSRTHSRPESQCAARLCVCVCFWSLLLHTLLAITLVHFATAMLFIQSIVPRSHRARTRTCAVLFFAIRSVFSRLIKVDAHVCCPVFSVCTALRSAADKLKWFQWHSVGTDLRTNATTGERGLCRSVYRESVSTFTAFTILLLCMNSSIPAIMSNSDGRLPRIRCRNWSRTFFRRKKKKRQLRLGWWLLLGMRLVWWQNNRCEFFPKIPNFQLVKQISFVTCGCHSWSNGIHSKRTVNRVRSTRWTWKIVSKFMRMLNWHVQKLVLPSGVNRTESILKLSLIYVRCMGGLNTKFELYRYS